MSFIVMEIFHDAYMDHFATGCLRTSDSHCTTGGELLRLYAVIS